MTRELVALAAVVLGFVLLLYRQWSERDLAKGGLKRDNLRLESDSKLAQAVGSTLESHATEMKRLKLAVDSIRDNMPRR